MSRIKDKIEEAGHFLWEAFKPENIRPLLEELASEGKIKKFVDGKEIRFCRLNSSVNFSESIH